MNEKTHKSPKNRLTGAFSNMNFVKVDKVNYESSSDHGNEKQA